MKIRAWMLWMTIALLTVLPLWLASSPPVEPGAGGTWMFLGTDERAREAIVEFAPDYQPWFSPVFEPASSEIASLLFALQAAIGAGVIGFWLGVSMARERAQRANVDQPTPSMKEPCAD
jgi:cobalt/nickel transport protein